MTMISTPAGYAACSSRKMLSAGSGVILAVLMQAAIPVAAAAPPKQEDPDACMMNGALRMCALHASISVVEKSSNPLIRADITIRIINTGKLPVSLFGISGEAMFLPDKGSGIASRTSLHGLPNCGNTVSTCAQQQHLSTMLLKPGGAGTFAVRTGDYFSPEAAARMAQAKTATFSYAIAMIDEEQRVYAIPLSVSVLSLDNGLLGSR